MQSIMLTDNDLPHMYNAGSLANGAKHEGEGHRPSPDTMKIKNVKNY